MTRNMSMLLRSGACAQSAWPDVGCDVRPAILHDTAAGNFARTGHDVEAYRAAGREDVPDKQFVARTCRAQELDRADFADIQR